MVREIKKVTCVTSAFGGSYTKVASRLFVVTLRSTKDSSHPTIIKFCMCYDMRNKKSDACHFCFWWELYESRFAPVRGDASLY